MFLHKRDYAEPPPRRTNLFLKKGTSEISTCTIYTLDVLPLYTCDENKKEEMWMSVCPLIFSSTAHWPWGRLHVTAHTTCCVCVFVFFRYFHRLCPEKKEKRRENAANGSHFFPLGFLSYIFPDSFYIILFFFFFLKRLHNSKTSLLAEKTTTT